MEKPKTTTPETPAKAEQSPTPTPPKEVGGNGKAEPTRYGDWEIGGKCVDF